MKAICDDLEAEHSALDAIVGGLSEAVWHTPSPAAGWDIADCVSHLWFFDQRAHLAMHPETVATFRADADSIMAAAAVGRDLAVEAGRALAPSELLRRWRSDRASLLSLGRTTDPSARIPWYGPAMAARSFVTARLMETWAHGQDVRDALGLPPEVSNRLKHVAHIGVRARPFAYANNRRELPATDVRVELEAPDGDRWVWGDESAADLVTGTALDFCLVVTQRRHVTDTDLRVSGLLAEDWIGIAQAFAGPPGPGRRPGQFRQ
jgi:uncharacterized protein (TIGR03084 family)